MKIVTVFQGVKWAGIEFALNFIFKFAIKLLLAKLLLPSDFGLVGMAMIFIAISTAASELGMGAALIQIKDNQHAEKLYNTAYWSGLLFGLCLYLIMCFIVGPFVAFFFDKPILEILMPILCLSVLVKPLNTIHIVILTRDMNFKKMAIISNSSTLIAGVIALITAYYGFGVWALAINNFLTIGLSVPLLIITTKWKPKLSWEFGLFKELFGFGVKATGSSMITSTTYNMDNLMIGKSLGDSALGAYTLAFTLTELIRQSISSVLNKVFYPVFSQLQDNHEKLKLYFLNIININAIIIFPIMFFFLLFAESFILDIFGNKWLETIPILRILAFAIMIHLLINSFASLIRSMGYPGVEFKIILGTTFLILIPGLYFGISNWGLIGAAYAILLNKLFLVLAALYVLNKHLNITFLNITKSLSKPFYSILITGITTLIINIQFPNIHVILLGCIYLFVYSITILQFEKQYAIMIKKYLTQIMK